VADWHIDRDRLYLDRITGIYRLEGAEPLFADWVTETLRISRGEMLTYAHMGFGSVYKEDLLLDVRMGVIVEVENTTRQASAGTTCRLLPP
jgi:hypothetical protein